MINLGKDTNVEVSLAVPGSVSLDLNQHILSQYRCDSQCSPPRYAWEHIPKNSCRISTPVDSVCKERVN